VLNTITLHVRSLRLLGGTGGAGICGANVALWVARVAAFVVVGSCDGRIRWEGDARVEEEKGVEDLLVVELEVAG